GLALPGLRTGDGPDAGGVVALHAGGGAADLQRDVLRGRRPHGERGTAVAEDGAELRLGRAGRVQVVEDARGLHAGRGEHGAGGGPLGGDDLAAQGLAYAVPVARVDGPGGVVLQVREP